MSDSSFAGPLTTRDGRHAIQGVNDISRRVAIAGLAGVLSAVAAPAMGQRLSLGAPTASPEGLVRTLLQRYDDGEGNEFNLILDVFPPGIVVPAHHHPAVGLNYVLEGVAESQYAGEPLRRFVAGDSFQDHADTPHLMFRNPDPARSLKILISFAVKTGQAFFVAP